MTQAATPASAISRPKRQGDRDNNGRFLPGHRVGANTRYRPGQSGNPQGRPPEVRYVSEYMHDLLPFPVGMQKKYGGQVERLLQGLPQQP